MADDPYTRAAEDRELRERVAASYTGGWDVRDALWWEAHPNEPGHEGNASPMERLRELQHHVFSRAGGSFEDREAYRALGEEIEREREAIRAAIAAAELGPVREQAMAAEAVAPDPTPASPQRSPRRRLRPLLVMGAAAVVVTSVVAVVGMQQEPAEVRRPAALDVFDRPQTGQDRPEVQTLGGHGDPESFRHLMVITNDAGEDRFITYATQGEAGICLLVVGSREGTIVASCESVEGLADNGITVTWAEGPHVSTGYRVRWEPNGDVHSEYGNALPALTTSYPTPIDEP